MNPTSGSSVTVTRVGTIPTVTGPDFGKPVSLNARTEALELLVEHFGCAPLASDRAVNEAANLMEADCPDAAIRSLMTVCDLTGAYRAIAVMAVTA
jgi:hypothetical protein